MFNKSGLKNYIYVWLIVFSVTSSLTFGQVQKFDSNRPISEQLPVSEKPTAATPVIALEEPINPAVYKLGPGDKLEFRVWGDIEVIHSLTVGPDGMISIPTVGELLVTGKTIDQAKVSLVEKARKAYPHSDISFRLTAVRQMKVLISGAVVSPGVYQLDAIDRLSTLIDRADGFDEPESKLNEFGKTDPSGKVQSKTRGEEEEDQKEPDFLSYPSKRAIRIIHKDNSETIIDFLHYSRSGNIDYNPVLIDGDQVHIPLMDIETGIISIFGAVKESGFFEFVEDDKLLDLVELAGGFRNDALLSDIIIKRFQSDDKSEKEIRVNFLNYIGERGPELEPDDRIFVRQIPEFRRKFQATVKGEVLYPGIYPIYKDSTYLSELIKSCGGFSDKADLKNASVVRMSVGEMRDPEYERLKKMSIAEMQEMEYEYFKTRSREEAPAVVVDFYKLFVEGDQKQDILLRDGDEIEIPSLFLTVNVTGQVNRPGLVRWIPGKNIEYYIEKAGGFSWNARKSKMRLIRSQSGMWLKPKNKTPVELGDTIFVPEKQEIEYWELWKDILLVASQIATIVLVIRSVNG